MPAKIINYTTWDLQNVGITEGLLHTVANGFVVFFGLDHCNWHGGFGAIDPSLHLL
jgi:hypothetical protein